jgi:hypothetical protein
LTDEAETIKNLPAAQAASMARMFARRTSPTEMQLPRDVMQLPFWPESTRGVPNGVLRSALFGAIKKGARPYF